MSERLLRLLIVLIEETQSGLTRAIDRLSAEEFPTTKYLASLPSPVFSDASALGQEFPQMPARPGIETPDTAAACCHKPQCCVLETSQQLLNAGEKQ